MLKKITFIVFCLITLNISLFSSAIYAEDTSNKDQSSAVYPIQRNSSSLIDDINDIKVLILDRTVVNMPVTSKTIVNGTYWSNRVEKIDPSDSQSIDSWVAILLSLFLFFIFLYLAYQYLVKSNSYSQ
jgi:hypothetical protein